MIWSHFLDPSGVLGRATSWTEGPESAVDFLIEELVSLNFSELGLGLG